MVAPHTDCASGLQLGLLSESTCHTNCSNNKYIHDIYTMLSTLPADDVPSSTSLYQVAMLASSLSRTAPASRRSRSGSQPTTPTLAPATRHPNLMLSFSALPCAKAKMVAALKVSPAPRVSTTQAGGKAGLCTTTSLPWRALAPSSPQGHTITVLWDM